MEKLPIYHIVFRSRRTMNLAMGRASEFGENAAFRGKVFTWDELERWWTDLRGKKAGRFVDYWDGYNIPREGFLPFLDGRFKDLNAEERSLLRIVRRLPARSYVIATMGKTGVLAHEVVHGLFSLRPAYREAVEKAVRRALRAKAIPNIVAALDRMGYGRHTHVDEINAYLCTGAEPSERMLGPGER
ncbi:MAG TPA: hypothetical protein VL426_02835, partial [Candidatus Binatia bacterium]|nr:hypothetical protein [Candidatus Binatia bacterium]